MSSNNHRWFAEASHAYLKVIFGLIMLILTPGLLFGQNTPPQPVKPGVSEKIPAVLHFCAQHCVTFTLENEQLVNRTNLQGQQNVKRVLTVESFTRDNVMIHRLDTGNIDGKPVTMTADYAGRMADGGNSLSGNGWKMTWGAALNNIPGDDTEKILRDAVATTSLGPPAAGGLVHDGGASRALGPLPVPDFGDLKKIESPSAPDPDIGGIWQQDAEPASRYNFAPVRIFLVALRGHFVASNLEPVPFLGPDLTFTDGTYSSPDSFKASVKDFTDSGVVRWYPAELSIPSSDHLRIFVKAFNEERRFTRISKIKPGEIPCNVRNPAHVSGIEALARHFLYTRDIDDRVATCWSYVGAEAGNPLAEVAYGDALSEGKYVPKDEAQAFRLYQRSAMRGNYFAAKRLAEIFDSGGIAPQSNQRGNYWAARATWLDPTYVHTGKFLRITQWAADTALPCDPAKPPQNNDTVFRAGRVAFEARAGDVAECWFKMSSARGELRADVYLGVMYYFGIGLGQNLALGLEHLKKASDGKDLFGMLYLADLFRFGIGLKANNSNLLLGDSMMREMMQMPRAPEVLRRVEGIDGLRSLFESPPDIRAQRCQAALAAAKSNPTLTNMNAAKGCDSGDNIGGIMAAMSHNEHTVEYPEEIFPEIFDPITLPADADLKDRALHGAVRLTP